MWRLGVGYRGQFKDWIATRPAEVECLEITAEHFFDAGEQLLQELAGNYPLYVHGLGLSLGTPGPLDRKTLEKFARVARLANAQWISEHVAFTRTSEVDLGHLNPLPCSQQSLDVVVDHALELAEICDRKLILENITTELQISGNLSETEFLNRLCSEAKCGLLLDVTNLFINSKNHQFDAVQWLQEIEPQNIVQLHVVGYSKSRDRYHDHHSNTIQADLMELIETVVHYAPIQAVILERDQRMDEIEEISSELQRLLESIEKHRPRNGDR